MSRIDQVNSLLRQELALAINRHIDLEGGMITVAEVDCAPDLKEAKILVSVLPERLAGTALKKLRHISGELAHELRKRLKFKNMPTFNWVFDERPSHASELEEVISHLDE